MVEIEGGWLFVLLLEAFLFGIVIGVKLAAWNRKRARRILEEILPNVDESEAANHEGN